MIELELRYRDMVVQKSQSETQYRGTIDATQTKNTGLGGQVENMKEQIHLM